MTGPILTDGCETWCRFCDAHEQPIERQICAACRLRMDARAKTASEERARIADQGLQPIIDAHFKGMEPGAKDEFARVVGIIKGRLKYAEEADDRPGQATLSQLLESLEDEAGEHCAGDEP